MSKSILNLALGCALLVMASPCSRAQTSQEEVARLVSVLQSDAPHKEKADACRRLAVIGTAAAVPALAALLDDEKLSHMARYGLETMPDPAVDDALRDALTRLRGRPLVGVIGSLGVRRDFQAVEPLIALLGHADPDVAQAAARALGSIGTAAAAQSLQAALATTPPQNQLAFWEGLLRCAETLMRQGQRDQAQAIYDQLRTQPAPHQARAAALRGAILARQENSGPLLREHLRSTDYILFAAAVRAAQELPWSTVTEALAADLTQLPPDRQVVVIQTLGLRGDAASLSALFALAKQSEKPVRSAAIRALGQIGHDSVVPVLVSLMKDGDGEISRLAQESLAGLPNREADRAVLTMLRSGETNERLAAIELLGRRRMVQSVPVLLKTAQDPDATVRAATVRQVGELGSSAELPAVLALLLQAKEGADLDAAEQALAALATREDQPAATAEMLTASWPQAQPACRAALLRVLATLGSPGSLQTVRAALADANADVRTAAIRALGNWKTPDAAPDLLDLAKNAGKATDRTLGLRGYLRLAAQPDLPVEKRLAMCREALPLIQRSEEKKLLLAALGGIQSPEALAMIEPHLDDPAIKEEACAAVVGLADKLLEGQEGARHARQLIGPLEKVAQAGVNDDLTKRANRLIRQARRK